MSNLNRFIGGSPGTVLVKLVFLSLLVGALLAFLDITPFELVDRFTHWIRSIFNLSFESVREIGRWVLSGAVIVIPFWLLSRIFNRGS